MNALITYVTLNQEKMVTELLQRGADVTLRDEDGDTALHCAVVSGNINVLRQLLAKGADPNAQNKLGGTPLMWAGTDGNDEAAPALLENGADHRLKDDDTHTSSSWPHR